MRSAAGQTEFIAEQGAGGAALVVRALRLAVGPGCWPLAERVIRDAGGPSGGAAAACLFRVLVQGLALGARRPLRLGFVGAPALTHDERALLQVIVAARLGDAALLEASAAWMVRPAAAPWVMRAAAGLAELLPPHADQRPLPARIASGES